MSQVEQGYFSEVMIKWSYQHYVTPVRQLSHRACALDGCNNHSVPADESTAVALLPYLTLARMCSPDVQQAYA